MKSRKIMFLSVAAIMSLAACTPAQPSKSEPKGESSKEPTTSIVEKDPNEVSVFLLSGQSNMQGNSSSSDSNLRAAFEDLGLNDYDDIVSGMPEVQSSIYCGGYGELDHTKLEQNSRLQNFTNEENQFAGKFVPTMPGLGSSKSQMGPEFGAAYYLKDYADADKPIFFVKMASNGSGFEQSGTQYNWPVKDADGNFPEINLYDTFAKPFLENNLKIIEEELGFTPVIKGWLWHQGESDSAGSKTEGKISKYAQRLGDMVAKFREDFADYAPDQDGDNIAFIDGMIYQGQGTSWGADTSVWMNEVKQEFADSADNNYIVDIYANEEAIPENELKPGQPGGDNMHYNTKSQLRLGMAYGKVIVDNGLLD